MLGFAHGGMSFLASKIGVYAYRHHGYSKTTTRDVIAARRSWRDRHHVITQNDDIVCGRSDGGLRSTRTETQTAAKSRMPPNVSSEFTRARLVEPSSSVFPIHAVFNDKRERVGARVKIPQHRIVHQIDLVVVEHERRGTAHGLLLEFKLQIARHLNLEFDSVHLLTDIDGNGTHSTLIPRYNLHTARMIIHTMLQVLPSKEKNGCSAERRRLCPRA